jgi:hypothetical protein
MEMNFDNIFNLQKMMLLVNHVCSLTVVTRRYLTECETSKFFKVLNQLNRECRYKGF